MVWPEVWYSYPASDEGLFPELLNMRGGDGIGPMGGPAYEFDSENRSPFRFPRVFDGHPLFYEWTRDYFKVFELNRPNGGRLADMEHLFGGPESADPNIVQDNPMDAEFGPDGALYTLEYGDGFFAELPEAQLARIDFVRGGQYTPIVQVSATPTSATAPPLTVRFSSAGTRDPDGDNIAYAWDFDADGDVDSRVANPTFTYTERGIFEATLRVTDTSGRSASASVRIVIGNQAPVVNLTVASTTPPFNFGDTVTLQRRGHRRSAGRLRARERGLRPRPRPARAPAELDRRMLGHDLGTARHRPRRRDQPRRRVRGHLHRPARRRRNPAAGQRRGRTPTRHAVTLSEGAPLRRRPFRGPSRWPLAFARLTTRAT